MLKDFDIHILQIYEGGSFDILDYESDNFIKDVEIEEVIKLIGERIQGA